MPWAATLSAAEVAGLVFTPANLQNTPVNRLPDVYGVRVVSKAW